MAFAALSVGTAAGGTARAASIKPTLTVAVDSTDIDHSDPALSYSVLGWQIEQETCDTLVGYSDHSGKVSSSLSPLGAAGLPKVTNNGKTYTFTIRSGLKFSNGHSITAANYEYAFDRDALKSLNSPVTGFMTGVVKGWDTENNSNTIRTVSGVTAKGQKLTVTLVKADGTMLPKLALPFFCPIDKAAPLYVSGKWKGSEYSGALPGSGPYFLYKRTVGKQMVLHLNTHYKGLKLHKASTIIMNMKVSSSAAFNGIDAKNPTYALDLNGNPEPSNNKNLAKKYGVNKSRFWVEPTLIISYLAMNTSRNTFGHVNLRKAVNQVVDRPGILNIGGYLSGTSQTQALPKALAGSHWSSNYAYPTSTPTNARFSAAKSQGNNCNGGDTINFWHGTSDPAVQAAALDSYDFHQLGCNVNSVGFAGYDRYTQAGIKGNNMDIMTAGWSDDYPDGFDWFGILFDGRTIGPDNNNDLAYINNSTLNAKTDACSKLAGSARTNCWGAEDQWMTSNLAPWATENSANFVDYISDNAHNYRYDAPFASVELGLLYQS